MGIFTKEKKPIGHGAVDSIIGEKAKFKGELVSSGAVSVNGEFEGKITSEGEIIIARGSKIVGNLQGGSIIVSGKVDGNINAEQNLEITKSGRVHGDLVGGRIVIEEGSSYRGRVKVEVGAEEAKEESTVVEKEPEESTGEIRPIKPISRKKTSQPQIF
ncbi:MAG: polymer-forming cytoskeletal protein [Candidatus Margulisiibacteriota bacterium]